MLRWLAPLVIVGLVAAAPARPHRTEASTPAVRAATSTGKSASRRVLVRQAVERRIEIEHVFVLARAIAFAERSAFVRVATRTAIPAVLEAPAVRAAARGPPTGRVV